MAIVNKKSSKYLCFVSWSIRGRSTHHSWSPHGYDHNSFDLHFDTGTVPLIPILQIKDPNDHAPLILQPMFVGTFEKFLVYLSSTISSLSPLSLNSFPPSLASGQPLQLHLRLQMIAGLSLFYNRRNCCRWSPIFFLPFWPVGSLIHSFFQRYSQIRQPILVTDIHKICLQALFFQNIGLCKNFDIVIS